MENKTDKESDICDETSSKRDVELFSKTHETAKLFHEAEELFERNFTIPKGLHNYLLLTNNDVEGNLVQLNKIVKGDGCNANSTKIELSDTNHFSISTLKRSLKLAIAQVNNIKCQSELEIMALQEKYSSNFSRNMKLEELLKKKASLVKTLSKELENTLEEKKHLQKYNESLKKQNMILTQETFRTDKVERDLAKRKKNEVNLFNKNLMLKEQNEGLKQKIRSLTKRYHKTNEHDRDLAKNKENEKTLLNKRLAFKEESLAFERKNFDTVSGKSHIQNQNVILQEIVDPNNSGSCKLAEEIHYVRNCLGSMEEGQRHEICQHQKDVEEMESNEDELEKLLKFKTKTAKQILDLEEKCELANKNLELVTNNSHEQTRVINGFHSEKEVLVSINNNIKNQLANIKDKRDYEVSQGKLVKPEDNCATLLHLEKKQLIAQNIQLEKKVEDLSRSSFILEEKANRAVAQIKCQKEVIKIQEAKNEEEIKTLKCRLHSIQEVEDHPMDHFEIQLRLANSFESNRQLNEKLLVEERRNYYLIQEDENQTFEKEGTGEINMKLIETNLVGDEHYFNHDFSSTKDLESMFQTNRSVFSKENMELEKEVISLGHMIMEKDILQMKSESKMSKLINNIFYKRKLTDDKKEINRRLEVEIIVLQRENKFVEYELTDNCYSKDDENTFLSVISTCNNEILCLSEELKKNIKKISILEFDIAKKERKANKLFEDIFALKEDNTEMQGQFYFIKTIKDRLVYTNIELEKKNEFPEYVIKAKNSDVSTLQSEVKNLQKINRNLRNQYKEEKDSLLTKFSVFDSNTLANLKKISRLNDKIKKIESQQHFITKKVQVSKMKLLNI